MSDNEVRDEVLEMMRELSERITTDIQPNEFTAGMLAKKLGIDDKRAARLLKEEETAGKLVSRKAYDPTSGRAVKAYRKAEAQP